MPVRKTLCSAVLLASLTVATGLAQERHDDQRDEQHYVRHDEWKKGAKIRKEDWDRGKAVEYKAHHLKAPTRGYEWRQVDGNYVLAAVATGVIASVIAASAAH